MLRRSGNDVPPRWLPDLRAGKSFLTKWHKSLSKVSFSNPHRTITRTNDKILAHVCWPAGFASYQYLVCSSDPRAKNGTRSIRYDILVLIVRTIVFGISNHATEQGQDPHASCRTCDPTSPNTGIRTCLICSQIAKTVRPWAVLDRVTLYDVCLTVLRCWLPTVRD